MRKLCAVISCIGFMVLLNGCTAIDSTIEKVILKEAGITERDDYILYQQQKEAGLIDEDGYYIDPNNYQSDNVVEENRNGSILVTFADNPFMDIMYYEDEDMTKIIDTDQCYLNPGDDIYAAVKDYNNNNSNRYHIKEYRILQYGEEGTVENQYEQLTEDGTLKYKIPDDFDGTEIGIFPIGDYTDRELILEAYYIDDNGDKQLLGNAGEWTINGEEKVDGSTKISPIEPYTLKFDYDENNYFYVDCEPECFTKDPNDVNYIEFWEVNPMDEDKSYSVELHELMDIAIETEKAARIKANGSEIETKGNKCSIDKLKYGDEIIIETAGECTIDGDYQHISAIKDPISSGYRYTLRVTRESIGNTADELNGIINVIHTFDVNLDPECEYGNCIYEIDGHEVLGEVKVKEGQKLTLSYEITDEDYTFADKSDGIGSVIHNIINSSERTVTIPVNAEIDGTTIRPDEIFNIVRKEEK